MKHKIFTNCFLVKLGPDGNPTDVCLGMKKRGFGAGMWNGAGGKPNEGVSIIAATDRETLEEFGVVVRKKEKVGEFQFVLKEEEMTATMHAFFSTLWDNDPVESEEMRPQWFAVGDMPYDQMWKSDGDGYELCLVDSKRFAYL
jgi:ADP-ribose pyrophosphatase YjhB (NUDIX family)